MQTRIKSCLTVPGLIHTTPVGSSCVIFILALAYQVSLLPGTWYESTKPLFPVGFAFASPAFSIVAGRQITTTYQ